MTLNTASRKFKKVLLILVVVMAFLAACTPAGTVTPEPAQAEVVTAPSTPTIMVTAPPIPTPLPTRTPLPSPTPTATLSPEEVAEAEQAAIRAEVLSYGIDLDDLAHSENEYIRNHPSVESFQEELDNNFGESELDWELMVLLEVEQPRNLIEYEQVFTTDGGWKFRAWARVAYKKNTGDWAITILPLEAYREETEELWTKWAENAGPVIYQGMPYEGCIQTYSRSDHGTIDFFQEMFQHQGNYYLDTGTVFRLLTEYPDPDIRLNSGEVGEVPRFTEEEYEQFRLTGDPSIFEYQAPDGTYFIWPFVHFASDICRIGYQTP